MNGDGHDSVVFVEVDREVKAGSVDGELDKSASVPPALL